MGKSLYRCHYCNRLRSGDEFEFADLQHKHFVCVWCKATIAYQSDKLEQDQSILDMDEIEEDIEEIIPTNNDDETN